MIAITPDIVFAVLDQIKWWAGIVSALVLSGKVVSWFKDIRVKDLKEIHEGVVNNQVELSKQTDVLQKGFSSLETSHTRDIQELRSDFRTFFSFSKPAMAAASSVPSHKLRKAAARSNRPIPKKATARVKNTKRG